MDIVIGLILLVAAVALLFTAAYFAGFTRRPRVLGPRAPRRERLAPDSETALLRKQLADAQRIISGQEWELMTLRAERVDHAETAQAFRFQALTAQQETEHQIMLKNRYRRLLKKARTTDLARALRRAAAESTTASTALVLPKSLLKLPYWQGFGAGVKRGVATTVAGIEDHALALEPAAA